jgi:hypothetical protein
MSNRPNKWGGLSAGSRPPGGLFSGDQRSLLEAGCRLNSPPHISVFFPGDMQVWLLATLTAFFTGFPTSR